MNIYPNRQKQLRTLVQKLGLPETALIKWDLLDLALTHPTFSSANYEQLEFVGDAVVRLAVAEFLWEYYSEYSVGEFSVIRAELVSDRTLAQIADSYSLERHLLLDKSAAADAAGRETRLADALEAVMGALYLSTHNLKLIRPWLDSYLRQFTTEVLNDPARKNYKAALQEITQSAYKVLPEYEVKELKAIQGKPQIFTAVVKVQGKKLGTGKGTSKKAAEQAAAKEAFAQLTNSMSVVS